MLSKDKYSKRTISTFEIVGAYFVNYYVDDLYQHAKEASLKGDYSSITEAYKYHIKYFHQAFLGTPAAKSGKRSFHHYNRIVKVLLTYYSEHSGHRTVSIVELVDRIVRELVPEEYFQDYNNQDKDRTMRTVLSNVITKFSELILTKYLKLVIDERTAWDLRPLQDEFLQLILVEREKLFSAFIKAGNPHLKEERNPPVMLERMKQTLQEQCAKTAEANNKFAQAVKAIQTFKAQVEIRDAEIRELREQVASLQSIIAKRATMVAPVPAPVIESNVSTKAVPTHTIEAPPPEPPHNNELYESGSDDGLIGLDDVEEDDDDQFDISLDF